MTKPYPWYYAVNDRPVKIIELPDGSGDALAFDWATGGFVVDRSYFRRTVDHGKDIDELTEAQFTARVRALREPIAAKRRATPLVWEATGEGEFPFRTKVGDRVLTIRVNDFPAEPLYSVLVAGESVEDLDDWPAAWVKPSPS
jgi:hypothetical protein